MPRTTRSNTPKKNDDRGRSRANGGQKSQVGRSRNDDRETRQARPSTNDGGMTRKSNGRFTGDRRSR